MYSHIMSTWIYCSWGPFMQQHIYSLRKARNPHHPANHVIQVSEQVWVHFSLRWCDWWFVVWFAPHWASITPLCDVIYSFIKFTRIPDLGSWIRFEGPGSRILNPGPRILDPGPWIKNPKSFILDPASCNTITPLCGVFNQTTMYVWVMHNGDYPGVASVVVMLKYVVMPMGLYLDAYI